jgi:hypothetical protein
MTEPLTKLPAALAKFQSQHHAAGRDGKGNYGTYTTLAGALAAIQPACEFGLSHTQVIQPISDELMVLRTILMHESGESISSDLPIPIRQEGGRGNAMQALGSALTYSRRYGVLAIYGLAGDDDEGEASGPPAKPPLQQTKPQSKPSVKTSATPAQPAATPAKAEASPSTEQVEPPLAKDEREELLAVMKQLMTDNRPAFDQLVAEYRGKFNLSERARISDHLQEKQHGDFIQQFLAALPPS